MRAPAETPYFFALESAMDELAVALNMDPIELRRVNDTQIEPIKSLPYTSRALMPCFDQAAEAFGWKARNPTPGSKRDGDWLIGWGCARTAHSQYMGGMIWGIGSALHEQTEIDPRASRYVNTNLADYMVPVNADVGEVHIIMVPEEDRLINPLGVKGIGEIGIVGTSAALANAIYHATGQRLRDLPLRIDGLVTGV
jgi:CO/xanthine dehydrogenase Mo-binding subunit